MITYIHTRQIIMKFCFDDCVRENFDPNPGTDALHLTAKACDGHVWEYADLSVTDASANSIVCEARCNRSCNANSQNVTYPDYNYRGLR